tara:strand:- start:255 stop:434 length:180 start_codon:yes stop_codon:yes gene_type:complete
MYLNLIAFMVLLVAFMIIFLNIIEDKIARKYRQTTIEDEDLTLDDMELKQCKKSKPKSS